MTAARRRTTRIVGDLLVSDRKIHEREVASAREAGFVSGPDVTYERMKELIERNESMRASWSKLTAKSTATHQTSRSCMAAAGFFRPPRGFVVLAVDGMGVDLGGGMDRGVSQARGHRR